MTLFETKAVIVISAFASLAVLERVAASSVRPSVQSYHRIARNLTIGGFNVALGPLLLVGITLWLSRHAASWRPEFAAPVEFCLSFIVLDFWAYALHRAYHEIPWMWRLHSVHHRDQFLDVSSAVRFHPGEVLVSTLLRAIPIMTLGLSAAHVATYEIILLLSALFHHSNIKLPVALERRLRVIIVTPSHHWVHHHANTRDTHSNYASFFTLWDRLFRSWSPTQRWRDMEIGIADRYAGSVPDGTLLQLLVLPVRRAD